MLSKALKELETNRLVKRTVIDRHPIIINYEFPEHGIKLTSVIRNLSEWGAQHRREIIRSSSQTTLGNA
ncbi:winged helix-turn-helix transcriptional regulator [Flavobacterium artemisiae]|uniref:Winged helix-turn-helix transcriptional regulator n=1 Tax=Flavobacterium artemisiae TaxID=2126556 RepID=A0ABW4HIL2_9FLAO